MNFFFKTKNLLPFLNSKYDSIPSSKIVRELLLLLNNLVSLQSLMRILGLTQCSETIFSPIMEAMRVSRKKIRQKVAGSLKTKSPTRTVPAAPIPVQTA